MLDLRIKEELEKECRRTNQPPELADQLVSWLESLIKGSSKLEDNSDVMRRLEKIYDKAKYSSLAFDGYNTPNSTEDDDED